MQAAARALLEAEVAAAADKRRAVVEAVEAAITASAGATAAASASAAAPVVAPSAVAGTGSADAGTGELKKKKIAVLQAEKTDLEQQKGGAIKCQNFVAAKEMKDKIEKIDAQLAQLS